MRPEDAVRNLLSRLSRTLTDTKKADLAATEAAEAAAEVRTLFSTLNEPLTDKLGGRGGFGDRGGRGGSRGMPTQGR